MFVYTDMMFGYNVYSGLAWK